MSDRDTILRRVRSAARHAAPRPDRYVTAPGRRDFEGFAAALASVGGRAHGPVPREALARRVDAYAREHAALGRFVIEASAAPLLGSGAYEVAAPGSEPHAFQDVGVAAVVGTVGVAEDGSVAVLGSDAPNRALLFLAQRLVLLLDAASIVEDLHRAFAALPAEALTHPHLTWISGPSKTADIEQTLVLGAHGPRALDVFVYADELRTRQSPERAGTE